MHFRNNRKSTIKNKKLTKPCPYHSRVNSIQNSSIKSKSPQLRSNSEPKQTRLRLRQLGKKQQRKDGSEITLPKLLKSSRLMQQQPMIEREYYNYGQRIKTDFNYYEDMKLSNEGWPMSPHFNRVFHAKNQDIVWKAQERVRQIYTDEYYNVRDELQIIKKIRERYKVIRNIEDDKQKLKHLLKQISSKKVYIDNQDEQSGIDRVQ